MRARIFTAAVVLAVASGAAAVPVAAHAAYPGSSGRIAFQWKDKLWTVKVDGTGLQQIAPANGSHNPRWSPNGRRIAINRAGDIWVMAANGSGVRRVTSGADVDFNPTWSPDGTRIAFARWRAGGPRTGSLWSVPVAGGAPTRLSGSDAGCAVEPTWAATGRYLVYWDTCAASVQGNTDAIRKLDLQTGRTSLVVGPAGVPTPTGGKAQFDSWGPDVTADGRHVVFAAYFPGSASQGERCDIAKTDLSGGGFTWVTGQRSCDIPNENPFASPDGTKVGYVGGYEISHIGFVRTGSTNDTWVFNGGYDWIYTPDWQPVH